MFLHGGMLTVTDEVNSLLSTTLREGTNTHSNEQSLVFKETVLSRLFS